MNITLKQLQSFIAVARHENLGNAAKELFITKGAVSQSLHELEKQLGTLLFDRVHPHIHLNHEGKRLLPLADELLHRSRDIELMFSEQSTDHFLQIGASKTIGSYLLPRLLGDFERAGLWLPEAHIANSQKLCALVASFALDAALLEGEEHHPDLVFEPWLADQMVVVAHREHPLAAGEKHPLDVLRQQRWLLREPASGTREYFDYNLAPLISPYPVALTLSSPEAILGMVAQGLGITFTSKLIAELPSFSQRFAIIQLDRDFPRTFSLCYHSKKHHSVSMDQFLSYCRNWNPNADGRIDLNVYLPPN